MLNSQVRFYRDGKLFLKGKLNNSGSYDIYEVQFNRDALIKRNVPASQIENLRKTFGAPVYC